MILVTLGTQDKSFSRLLEAIDKEIENGNIKDKVIVQAGYTKYESKNMEIFDLIPSDEFDKLMSEADLIITHGGAGSILTALKNNKKVIAAPRLKKYKEHTNDHQKEIIDEFSKQGYILSLYDFSKLGKVLEKVKSFKPKKYVSNTDKIKGIVTDYIEKDDHTSWYNKTRYIFKYLLVLAIYTLIVFLVKKYLMNFIVNNSLYTLFTYHYVLFFVILYFINKKYIYNYKTDDKLKKICGFAIYLIFSIAIYYLIKYMNFALFNILFFVLTLLINKLFIFVDNSKLKRIKK